MLREVIRRRVKEEHIQPDVEGCGTRWDVANFPDPIPIYDHWMVALKEVHDGGWQVVRDVSVDGERTADSRGERRRGRRREEEYCECQVWLMMRGEVPWMLSAGNCGFLFLP